MNSTIIRKKKQLKCGCFDYAFSKGRCKLHATVEDTKKRAEKYAAQPTVRKAGWFNIELTETEDKVVAEIRTSLPKSFTPTKEMLNDANDVVKEFKLGVRGKSELWDWFLDRRDEMVGKCQHCSKKSLRDSDKFFHHSVCHILPKSKNMFPSVATNKFNWLELCQECHDNFDHHIIDISELNCFDDVIEKVTKMYPHIAQQEKRKIPAILIEYIKTNS